VRSLTNEIEVVLFDVGGVLVELAGVSTMLAWLNNRLCLEELWTLWLSSSAVRDFESGRSTPDEFAGQVIRDFSLPVGNQEFLDAFAKWPVALYPGALEVVQSLPARFTRATLTNSSILHWSRVTKDLGLGTLFDHHFASHLTGRIKPDAEAFEYVVKTLRCKPSAVFFLDDNTLNVDAARLSGMHAMRVQGATEARRALEAAGILAPATSPAG
jgi:putative hydrolase of the HAD superfamily